MLLVINSLGADTYMHLQDHINFTDKSNSRKPGACLIIEIESQFFAIKRFLSDRITIVVPMHHWFKQPH